MKKLYAIYDRIAAEIVGLRMYSVMTFRTDEEAVRYFADAILDDKSILAKHPGDYELIYLGIMNETGKLSPNQEPQLVITGDSLLAARSAAPAQDELKLAR